ncbi:MAG: hypothetical protein K8S98_08885 [Planctomycetes bacterium]|nr:hypothetical protein [Planctomycetota bacterium]
MQETAGDVLVRYRALAERVAFGLCRERASAVVARAAVELASEPPAGLRERFLRRVIELANEPAGSLAAEDATTLFGREVFERAHARWHALEVAAGGLPVDDFALFEARLQRRETHAAIAARSGQPAQAVAARERAVVERLRHAVDPGGRRP